MANLVRAVIQLNKFRDSDQWPRETATVWTSGAAEGQRGAGVAQIIYYYSHHGHYFSGTHRKAFRSYGLANRYVAGFPKGTQIVVRVKPEHPKTSILRDADQEQVAAKIEDSI